MGHEKVGLEVERGVRTRQRRAGIFVENVSTWIMLRSRVEGLGPCPHPAAPHRPHPGCAATVTGEISKLENPSCAYADGSPAQGN